LAVPVPAALSEFLAAAAGAGGRAIATGILGIGHRAPPGLLIQVFGAATQAAGGLFGNGGAAGAAGPVKVFLFFPGGDPASDGVLVVETVDFPLPIPVPPELAPTTTA
jgi:hypothetical protein